MLLTLLHSGFKLCRNLAHFHHEIEKVKIIFENNDYSKTFGDFCIKKYLDKVSIKEEELREASKEGIYLRPFFYLKKITATENLFS